MPRFTMSNLLNFFALDGNNPCSIYSCVEMAWNNAHAVRGSLVGRSVGEHQCHPH